MKRFDVRVFSCDFLDQPRNGHPEVQVVRFLLVTPNLFQGQSSRSISVRLSRRLRRCRRRRLLNSTGRRYRKIFGRNFRYEFWHRFGRRDRSRSVDAQEPGRVRGRRVRVWLWRISHFSLWKKTKKLKKLLKIVFKKITSSLHTSKKKYRFDLRFTTIYFIS